MGERGSRRMVLWDVPPIFPQGSDAPVGRGRLQVKSKHFSWPQYTKIRFVGLVSSAIAYGCLIHTQHRQQQIWSNVACIYQLVTWVYQDPSHTVIQSSMYRTDPSTFEWITTQAFWFFGVPVSGQFDEAYRAGGVLSTLKRKFPDVDLLWLCRSSQLQCIVNLQGWVGPFACEPWQQWQPTAWGLAWGWAAGRGRWRGSPWWSSWPGRLPTDRGHEWVPTGGRG